MEIGMDRDLGAYAIINLYGKLKKNIHHYKHIIFVPYYFTVAIAACLFQLQMHRQLRRFKILTYPTTMTVIRCPVQLIPQ